MAALRRVLEEGSESPQYIATVIGRGYRFIAPAEVTASVEVPAETTSFTPANHNLPISNTRVFGRSPT